MHHGPSGGCDSLAAMAMLSAAAAAAAGEDNPPTKVRRGERVNGQGASSGIRGAGAAVRSLILQLVVSAFLSC
jgi:hypothetical protein